MGVKRWQTLVGLYSLVPERRKKFCEILCSDTLTVRKITHILWNSQCETAENLLETEMTYTKQTVFSWQYACKGWGEKKKIPTKIAYALVEDRRR